MQIARKIDKLGMWSSDTAEVFFDDVRVPCKNVIGEEGMGFTYQMLQFQEERLWAAANSERAFRTVLTAHQAPPFYSLKRGPPHHVPSFFTCLF